ncbi:MAG: site-specific integrase [Acidobacteriota bacterium]|nr:site-specific integrase [Acidobacteriota bacterium]
MRAAITKDLIRELAGPCEVWDTKLPGLVLRVRATGAASYAVIYGRAKKVTLGKLAAFTPAEARERAKQVLGEIAHGKDPQAERRKRRAGTLRGFLTTQYQPWAEANRKTGAQTVTRILAAFPDALLNHPLAELTGFHLEQWRTSRRKADLKDTTVNRDLDALRAVLSKSVEWGLLAEHPMRRVRRAKVDTIGRLRYLSPAEEQRLRAALEGRDDSRRAGRGRFNAWRAERGYKTLPDYGTYPDHITPITLLALNTGLRRGELLGLTWGDVDLLQARLTVRGASAKTGLTRHVPLNTEAVSVLRTWKPTDAADSAPVFPGPDGGAMFSLKTAWQKVAKAAKLDGFTFHDLRHTFASKLVQAGVDLNTVRELLGHADIKMTLRYSHLAPEHRAAAVAKLVKA